MDIGDKIEGVGQSEMVLKNDPVVLIESVRQSVLDKIKDINSAADDEIEILETEVNREIELFRSEQKKKYDEEIEYEEERLSNLSSIEIKKQKLDVMDLFIKAIISEAARSLRSDLRYTAFLKWCVLSAMKDVSGGDATILLSAGDLDFSEEIMKEIKNEGYSIKVNISTDESITSGGAMVIDNEPEIVINNTVERIIHRQIEGIKRVIVRELNKYSDGEKRL